MTDTLKTSIVGATGAAVTGIGVLPDIVSVAVGIVTFVYLLIKIDNELETRKKNKE
tara:strand:+ start:159 stop:326 length:168 start_codon:yes stop_codon:yes gene_type:complete